MKRRGLSLLEVLISLVLFVTAFFPLMALMRSSGQEAAEANEYLELIDETYEKLVATPFPPGARGARVDAARGERALRVQVSRRSPLRSIVIPVTGGGTP